MPGGSSSVVEHLLAKEDVAGSNPVFRSTAGLVTDHLLKFSTAPDRKEYGLPTKPVHIAGLLIPSHDPLSV